MTNPTQDQLKKEFEEKFVDKQIKQVDTSNSIQLYHWKKPHSHQSQDVWNWITTIYEPKVREEMLRELNPGLKDLLPVMDKTHKWFKLHDEAKAEIVFSKREDEYGVVREIPVKAIYHSPLVKFQELSQLPTPDKDHE